MKLDDTHPDYFVDDSETGDSRTITFGDEKEPVSSTEPSADNGGKSRKRKWKWIVWTLLIVIAGLCGWVWLQFYNPYVEDARMKCYVVSVEKRGVFFKTYEADLLTEKSLNDSARIYSNSISVSVPDSALATRLQDVQGTGKLVELNYEQFRGVLPWRGASKTIVTGFTNSKGN